MLDGPTEEEVQNGCPSIKIQQSALAKTIGVSVQRLAYLKQLILHPPVKSPQEQKREQHDARETEVTSAPTLLRQVQLSMK